VSNLFCQSMASTQFLCSNILFLVAGFSRAELNTVGIKDIGMSLLILLIIQSGLTLLHSNRNI